MDEPVDLKKEMSYVGVREKEKGGAYQNPVEPGSPSCLLGIGWNFGEFVSVSNPRRLRGVLDGSRVGSVRLPKVVGGEELELPVGA